MTNIKSVDINKSSESNKAPTINMNIVCIVYSEIFFFYETKKYFFILGNIF